MNQQTDNGIDIFYVFDTGVGLKIFKPDGSFLKDTKDGPGAYVDGAVDHRIINVGSPFEVPTIQVTYLLKVVNSEQEVLEDIKKRKNGISN